ncbi:guanine deaminase [Thamnocephalis sphaerospora]|uniref:Guanine deaminase n=1 Tax=Thamnocephalis sphaerospora TaxID=78915 RepID=A0A4P9XN29_9FUNG|nr:guanine deaminase [Thamnocephalis sphaerospora]|eukprot:RKP06801.1 guanine deaminase [Thamnocephalis sphaerospora]
MTAHRIARLFYGTVVQPSSLTRLEIARHAIVGVGHDGRVAFVRRNASLLQLEETLQHCHTDQVVRLKDSQFLLPGFVDTHIHASQYANAGNGLDLQLLDWLNEYTFPEEARFQDPAYAAQIYRRVVTHTLRTGTTCAAYFATIHKEATEKLVDVMRDMGQRGWVGKVCMNQNTPAWYRETPEQSVADTRHMIDHGDHVDVYHTAGLVEACVTPRFAPHCTADSMRKLGELAREEGARTAQSDPARGRTPIQSHLSENHGEIAWVRQLFPEASSYTDVYAQAGLLSPRTVMAHCVHLSQDERDMLRTSGTAVSHCAHSNFNIRSGVLNVRRLLDEGIKVSLGTDMSGGHSASMLDSIRGAIAASRMICIMEHERPRAQLSITETVYLATLGGIEAMGLQDRVGSLLTVGHEFDALLRSSSADPIGSAPATASGITPRKWYLDMLEKFLMCGDDRNILHVWVRGRRVAGAGDASA